MALKMNRKSLIKEKAQNLLAKSGLKLLKGNCN